MAKFFKETLSEYFEIGRQQLKLAEIIPNASERNQILNHFRNICKNVERPHN